MHTTAVSGQECTDTVGSLNHNDIFVPVQQTFILAGYTVPCNGTVIAWEFCYQLGQYSVTFYPGIWRIIGMRGGIVNPNIDYELIQSNSVTYNSSVKANRNDYISSCQRVNLSTTDQFTAPAGSVVGLYSNVGPILLCTNTQDSLVTTYKFGQNQSNVTMASSNNDVNYNIAIRVHLGKWKHKINAYITLKWMVYVLVYSM